MKTLSQISFGIGVTAFLLWIWNSYGAKQTLVPYLLERWERNANLALWVAGIMLALSAICWLIGLASDLSRELAAESRRNAMLSCQATDKGYMDSTVALLEGRATGVRSPH